MAEKTIWKGTSSHWKNFNPYALFIVSIPVAVGLHWWLKDKGVGLWIYGLVALTGLWAFWKWLQLKSRSYELTSERLITTHGILTKVTDTLELYRVRDLQVVQPLLQRMLGLQNVHLVTMDATDELVILDYLPVSFGIGDQIRKAVEESRDRKRVRTMDVVSEEPGDHAHDVPPSV